MAYEIAPFNVKMTVVQNNLEVNLLTNKITSISPLPSYSVEKNGAPFARQFIAGLLSRIEAASQPEPDGEAPGSNELYSSGQVSSIYPYLPFAMRVRLVAETISAVIAIGGHENPPLRHIVGAEAVTSIKEKLKAFSEGLEELVEVSYSVDVGNNGGKAIKVEDAGTE